MRLFRRIFDYSKPLCLYSGKYCIHSCANCNKVKVYLIAYKLVCCDMISSVHYLVRRTKRLESFQMLIYRSVAKVTAARHRNKSLVKSSKQCAKKIA